MESHEIKAQWEENGQYASGRGSVLHYILECHNNNFDLEGSTYMDIQEVNDYLRWRTLHFTAEDLIPFRTEFKMHTGFDLSLTGTADLLAIKRDHPKPKDCNGVLTLHMIDWKFSKGIHMDNQYEKGHGPCKQMDNCNYNHYLLQQNTYKWLLETYYPNWKWNGHEYTSVQVVSMHLAVFHPNHGRTGLYVSLPVCSDLIDELIQERRQQVQSRGGK